MASYTTEEPTSSMDSSQKATLPKSPKPANCLSIILSGRGRWSCESVSLKNLCIPPVRGGLWACSWLLRVFCSDPRQRRSCAAWRKQPGSIALWFFYCYLLPSPAQNFHANSTKPLPAHKQLQITSLLYLSKDLLFPTS